MRFGGENDVRRAAELEPTVFDEEFLKHFWKYSREKQTLYSMAHTVIHYVANCDDAGYAEKLDTDRAVMKIIYLVMKYVQQSIGTEAFSAVQVAKTASMMFKISFDSYLQEGTIDSKLLQYLANPTKNTKSCLQLL